MDLLPDDILRVIFARVPRVCAPNRRVRALLDAPVHRMWYRRMTGLRNVPFLPTINHHHMWFGIDPSDDGTWSATVDTPRNVMFSCDPLPGLGLEMGDYERTSIRLMQGSIRPTIAIGLHLDWFETEYDPNSGALIFRLQEGEQQRLGFGVCMRDCDYGCIFVSHNTQLERAVLNLHWPSPSGGADMLIRLRLRPIDTSHVEHLQAWGVV